MHARVERVMAGEPAPSGREWREILAERGIDVQMYKVITDPIAEEQIASLPG
jgi:hypothetical protein